MTLPLTDLGPLIADPLATATPQLSAQVADSRHPLALLPVRLETRMFDLPDGTVELRIRVYPDKIHVDAHDPALSADEAGAGRTYWRAQWQAGSDEPKLRLAWQQLTDRFEPGRAAWIARAMAPTNAAHRGPTVTPAFPDPGPARTTQRVPVARLLPARWTATAYRDGQVAASVTGFDVRPDLAVAPDITADVTVVDDAPATDAGMRWMIDFAEAEAAGMALRLPLGNEPRADVLVVSGVRGEADDALALAALLDAHHFTDGLAFVSPGTPSNNASGERAGYASRDRRGERSYAVEAAQQPPEAGSNADLVARALGVAVQTLAVEGGAERDDAAAAMRAALWPATWGYYLTQFGGLALEDADWAREHATAFLHPGGALPVLRCGRQPYGLLAVTSLGRLASDDARLTRVRDLLAALRDVVWRPALGAVPRVGRSSDPNGDVIDVLRTDAIAATVAVRRMVGPHYLRHLRLFLGEDLDAFGFWARLQALTGALAGRVGIGLIPARQLIYQGGVRPITAPLVGDVGYLADLLAVTDPDALARPVPDQPVPLLHALLRHALLRTFAESGARLLGRLELVRDAELVDLVPAQPQTPTWPWQRAQQVPGTTQTVAQALGDTSHGPIADLRAALSTLSASTPDVLERQLRQHLDATSHRLDAWVTSLANRRLAEVRAAAPQGITVGGYGWVEGLRRESRTTTTQLPPDEPGPLLATDADPGFIHAPSLTQASAAALLRNAHLAHGGAENGPYAILLTSSRVRTARRLLDGVRQGQPLGALLGYSFERRLRDRQLDDLIDPLRGVGPRPGETGEQARAAGHAVDGLVLHRAWNMDPDAVLAALPGLGDRRPRLVNALNMLAAEIDAAADAVTAEGVHQLVRGNLARSAISLDAIAGSDAPPPPLDFLRTPRTGTAVTHRVAVLLRADLALPAGWSPDTPRARAEPVLNAWAGHLLGPPPAEFVGTAPLDLLAADEAPASPLRTVAAALQKLISGARGLDGADLQPPHADPQPGLDLDEFEHRAAAAQAALAAATPAEAASFGIPAGAVEGPAGELVAAAVTAEMQRRVAEAERHAAAPSGEAPAARRQRIERRFGAVFGPGFVAVPRFAASTAADLTASVTDPALTDDPLAAETWLLRMERLRPALARFGTATRAAQVLGGTHSALVQLAQVPHQAGQRWVGLPLDGRPLRQGVVSLALHGIPADLIGQLAGLLVDEWTEVIPSATETTGIAFRYDPPDAMAPQAILLAVAPVPGQAWTVGTLNQVLLETLDLAHLRTVGPDLLGDALQYLPAAVLAFNPDGDAVATDLNPLTR